MRSTIILFLPIFAACCQPRQQTGRISFKQIKLYHEARNLSLPQIETLASLTDKRNMNEILDNICIPRVVGSPNHEKVKKYIKSTMRNLGWDIETDTFEDYTPVFGILKFENIIARLNPNAHRYLTLACHFDSKFEKDYEFVGATDSAVPCMQLINLARVMQKYLKSIKNNNVSLMLLFLDGEEAFQRWGPKDSIYGARHLAAKWHNKRYTYGTESNISDLDRIDLFVLLDLIGAPNPIFYNYFNDSIKWYSLLSQAENTLASMRKFENYPYGNRKRKYFQDVTITAGIEDDHLPFLRKNVKILHVIPYPFPDIWHTARDNRNNINMSTIENVNKILRVFVASYLNMRVEEEEDVQSRNTSEL
ncbi:glutaminyl-peptide cyclotransferase-like [Phymastichus coffea]|uniref:glutaminyl-peptide cyclotransferase-like n=1 Tax=Phymastichus coffea TaxID=108790 RepID=UPI00273C8B3F|nr:glutaminyl-peptide cyclotransferase-like [Phymastichus coffea]